MQQIFKTKNVKLNLNNQLNLIPHKIFSLINQINLNLITILT